MTPTPSSSTAAAADATFATKADIARAIIEDDEERPDKLSNRERVALVLATFGAETIDFEEVFDYGVALVCYYPMMAEAWKQLAILQSVYVEALYIYQWIDDDEYHTLIDYLRSVTQNIEWHIQCLLGNVEYKPLVVIPDRPIH